MRLSDKAIRLSGLINMILWIVGMFTWLSYDNKTIGLQFFPYILSGVAFVFGMLVLFKEAGK